MAMKNCKECGNEVSTKAVSCPKCGAVLKKKTGCLGYIGAGILILFVLGVIGHLMSDGSNKTTSTTSSKKSSSVSPKPKVQKTYKEGETVNIGYTSYAVWRSWWSSKLSDNQFLDDKPDAMFLFIDLTIRNDDKKARSIPPFKLVDENGAEYETTSKGWAVEGSIGVLASLNPGVEKKGTIVFDVPQSHSYKLNLSGGYWSGEDAFVTIAPK
uniref:Uncharacterized protein n=1 Tax=viral metagenome TaxID=1070528 RepID=A0A6M3J1D6_9ZZZZ